ncbi:MAG: hypothetical protein GXY13_10280 [Acidimicrobiales bacterium]|nr:hypothetical protein [Acidimicrobiales bacterium]
MTSAAVARLGWIVTISVTWLLLQGDVTVANAVGGLIAGTVIVLAVPMAPRSDRHRVHPWALVRFVAFVGWSLVASSVRVAATALRPTDVRLRSGIVAVDLPGATPLVTTMVANAITVTPGTMTIEAGPVPGGARLHVHVLGLGDVERFRAEVDDLRARATAAVTPIAPVGAPDGGGTP